MTVEAITPAAWSDALQSLESRWSPLDGPAMVVVDGDWELGPPPGEGSHQPAVPVVGVVRSPLSADAVALADACDVLVGATGGEAPGAVADADEQMVRMEDRIGAHRLAASVLCQLLRGSGDLDVAAGLLAESLAYATLQAGPEHQAWLATRPPASEPRHEGLGAGVSVTRSEGTLTVTLDRPDVHNAVNRDVRDGLVEAFDLAATDRSIDAVRLLGAGPSFCSGGDLTEFGMVPDPVTGHAVRTLCLPARSLARIADRVEVTVHGACVGAGVELAAFAWAVAAVPGASFRLPEVGMGLVPGSGGTVSLPRRIGRHRTAWLALSGTEIDLATARAWGLVDEVQA